MSSKKISCTHLEYLKKDLKKKKSTQILAIEISSLIFSRQSESYICACKNDFLFHQYG